MRDILKKAWRGKVRALVAAFSLSLRLLHLLYYAFGSYLHAKWEMLFVHKAAFIMYPTGGAEDFRGGVLKFLEQKKGVCENCLNIS